jgi:dTDP-4-dehydrorhamnose 3,5-epimerase
MERFIRQSNKRKNTSFTRRLILRAQVVRTAIPEVIRVDLEPFKDQRGFFAETFNARDFIDYNLPVAFVQDNHSRSEQYVLRGFHYQNMSAPQGKLVRCIAGAILDVALDLRVGSPTFGRCVAEELNAENMRQLYVPVGFGHAFLTLSATAQVQYKCTHYYDPKSEGNIIWNDPDIDFKWPVQNPLLSERDQKAPSLKTYLKNPAFIYPAHP